MPYYYKYVKYKNKYLDLKKNYVGGLDEPSQPPTEEKQTGVKQNEDSEKSPTSLMVENKEPEILDDKDIEKMADNDLKLKYKKLK